MWMRGGQSLYVRSAERRAGGRMKLRSRGAQMLVTTAGAFTAFSLMTIAVGTDYWLYSRGVCRSKSAGDNDTNRKNEEVLTHSGLWRQCCMEGIFKGVCKNIDHFSEDADYEQDAAEYLLRAVRATSLFPILSVGLLFIAGVCVAASEFYKSRHNVILSAGIFFISAGLSNIIGMIVYISSSAGDPNQSESKRSHWYGWSFYCGALSFIIAETVGVLTVHLFIDTHRRLRASTRSLQPRRQEHNRASERSPARHTPTATRALNASRGFAHLHNSVIANNTFEKPHIISPKSERGVALQNSLRSGFAFPHVHTHISLETENGVITSQNYIPKAAGPTRAPASGNDSARAENEPPSVSPSGTTRRTTPV